MTKAIICDIDGTLAVRRDRDPYDFDECREDFVNEPVRLILFSVQIGIIDALNDADVRTILVSSREEKYRDHTEQWLFWHQILFSRLFMRSTGDQRRDDILKKEIYETHIKNAYEVLFVLDDRNRTVEMWRQQGLTCLQVADGNF